MKPRHLLCLAATIAAACNSDQPRSVATVTDSIPTDVRAVCDSLARSWKASRVADVRQVDSTMDVYPAEQPVRGCSVLAHAGNGVDSLVQRLLFWPADTAPPGWTDRGEFRADGADGGSKIFERGGIVCHIEIRTEGHDDTDSTHVPKPWLDERTHCWRGMLRRP